MRALTTLVVSALILAGISLAGAAPAASATHHGSRVCNWTIDDDWHTSTAPNWSQVDWETSQCVGQLQLQQGSWCATRTGEVLVKSGIVVNLEIEDRATCTDQQRLVKCAYRINPGSGWGSWVTDCNPPLGTRQ